MKFRVLSVLVPVAVLGTFVACSTTNPNTPSVSFVAPLASQPSNGAIFNFNQQPITLTITNAVRTGAATVTYSVDVATDKAFATKVFTQTNIAENPAGTTTFQVSGLAGNTTFFWRSEAVIDGVTGQPSAVQSFFVRPNIVFQAPALQSPANNATIFASQPAFVVTDAARTGTPGSVTYDFQISTNSAFSSTVASATIAEQPGSTTWNVSATLPFTTLFWRARANDTTNGIVGPFSAPLSFTFQQFSLSQAAILNSPQDLGRWTETTTIDSILFTSQGIAVGFEKHNGPDRWPDIFPPGFQGTIQYCLGMVFNIDGKWYASAPIEMWNDRDLGGGPPSQFAENWFYDPARWAPMTFHQPAVGETIGFFVTEGDTRNDVVGVSSPLRERSNVVFLPLPTDNDTLVNFSPSGTILSSKKVIR